MSEKYRRLIFLHTNVLVSAMLKTGSEPGQVAAEALYLANRIGFCEMNT